MKDFSVSPAALFVAGFKHRGLIAAMAKREVIGRYKGSFMGLLWSFFNPVLMLTVYTFIFSVVFKVRWSGGSDSKTEFALILFAGLIVFNIFGECINRAPGLVLSNQNYVKKVVFPLEILPLVSMGGVLFHSLVSLGVWVLFYLLFFGFPHPTILLLPLMILPLIFFTLGTSWFLASLGVYFRDVGQVVGIIITLLTFLSPIFYPITALPEKYRPFILLNPLTPTIEQVRSIMIWGHLPDMRLFLIYLLAAAAWSWLGFVWFQKTRKGFADVL